jgi:TRAP-type C4-dicarboxylate transport system permease small subunit
MDRLLRIAYVVSRAGAWFGGALLLAAALLIGFDVTIRQLFVRTIGGADELAGYALAIGSAWAFGFTLLRRAHIRIDTLYVTLPVRVCAVLDIFALMLFTFFMAVVTWHGSRTLSQSIQSNSHSISPLGTPLAIPQTFWVIGLVTFILIALLLLVRAVMALITGDVQTVARIVGSRTAAQEVDYELKEVEKTRARKGPAR